MDNEYSPSELGVELKESVVDVDVEDIEPEFTAEDVRSYFLDAMVHTYNLLTLDEFLHVLPKMKVDETPSTMPKMPLSE